MRPIKFKEANVIMVRPPGMTEEECGALDTFSNGKECISCWELNKEDLELIQQTGKVYLSVFMAGKMPPVYLTVETPFKEA